MYILNSKTILKNNAYSVLKNVVNKTNINVKTKDIILNDFINSNFNNFEFLTLLSDKEIFDLKSKLKKAIQEQLSIIRKTRELCIDLYECHNTLKFVFMVIYRYENNETDKLLRDKSNLNNSKNTTYYNSFFYRERNTKEQNELDLDLYDDDDDYNNI